MFKVKPFIIGTILVMLCLFLCVKYYNFELYAILITGVTGLSLVFESIKNEK